MSSIKKFNYTNSRGESKEHDVFVLSETPDYLMGIDGNSLMKTIIDKNDKDLKGSKSHSVWGEKDYLSVIFQDDGNNHIVFAKPFNLIEKRKTLEKELSKKDVNFYKFLIFYRNDDKPIDMVLFNKIFEKYNIDNGTDLVNDLDDFNADDSSEFFLFTRDLNWFSYAARKEYIPIPGWEEMLKTYEAITKVFENREPTQYQSLQESRSGEKKPIEGFDQEWFKAFRNFKKSGIKEI